MIDLISDWSQNEAKPALRVIASLSLQAVDALPLPILVVGFLALLAMLQWPSPRQSSSPLLPNYSPTFLEKSRLSPLTTNSPPSFFPPQNIRSSSSSQIPIFYPSFDNTRPQYVATLNNSDTSVVSESGTRSPPRTNIGRRSSKQRDWKRSSLSSLSVVEELSEEKSQV